MMKCPKCGAMLEDDSKFCASCGINLQETSENSFEQHIPNIQQSMTSTQKSAKKIDYNIKGLVIGTIIMIIGFFVILNSKSDIIVTSFGADFYTYTYKGIVAITDLLVSIEKSIGWLIVSIGAVINVFSIKYQ